jgi:hypothetical protein
MPAPRSNRAPFFSGNMSDPLDDFLREFEELAHAHQLTDAQKVETVIRYVSTDLKDYWKSLDGYSTRNWTDFRLSLQTAYPDLNPRNRHSKQRLYEYIRQHSQARIRDELDVLRYYRHFNFLTKSLLDSRHLTEEERDQAFWYSFHPKDRGLMTARLVALQPQRHAGDTFELAEVFDTA